MEPVLAAEGLWKVYDTGSSRVEALRGLTVGLVPGEMAAVMGPSGCGKTTLLNCISGLDDISAGDVRVGGTSLPTLSDRDRTALRAERLGFIFQSFNLMPVLSAVENVELPLLMQGVAPAEARRRALAALGQVGLEDWAAHRPAELSGGQQQRVTVARAFVHEPAVILADEPTGNLDSKTSAEVMTLLQRLNREQGITMLIVTHDPGVAARCTRLVAMADGRIAADGPVEAVLEHLGLAGGISAPMAGVRAPDAPPTGGEVASEALSPEAPAAAEVVAAQAHDATATPETAAATTGDEATAIATAPGALADDASQPAEGADAPDTASAADAPASASA